MFKSSATATIALALLVPDVFRIQPRSMKRKLLTAATALMVLASVSAHGDQDHRAIRAWATATKDLKNRDDDAVNEWEKRKKPHAAHYVELDPPYPVPPGPIVEIEWFFTYVDAMRVKGYNDAVGNAWTATRLESDIGDWTRELPESVKERIRLRLSPVSTIPHHSDLLDRFNELYQRMTMSLDPETQGWLVGVNLAIHRPLRTRIGKGGAREIRSDVSADEFIANLGIDLDAYHAAAISPEAKARRTANDRRLAEITERVEKSKSKRATREPRQPIVLIDGRYVLQLSTTKRLRTLIRGMGWLVEERLKARSRS